MNACIRRLIRADLLSHVKVSILKRGMLTCYTQSGAKNSLAPCPSLQHKQLELADISGSLNDLSIKNGYIRTVVTDPLVVPRGEIGTPIGIVIHDFELPTLTNREMMDPVDKVIEKKAHKMLRIRKKKMKKHKWKKVQKKMRFVYAKMRRKRKAKKEAIFKEELREISKEAESYNPEKQLEENLRIFNCEIPINRVGRCFSPKWVVDEYLEQQRKKKILDERVDICLKKLG